MKIRNGFVSNSSSSSFIIYTPVLSKAQLSGLYSYLGEQKRNMISWGDSGKTYEKHGEYLFVEFNYLSDFFSMLESLNISNELFCTIY
jgi:hypothetical protein